MARQLKPLSRNNCVNSKLVTISIYGGERHLQRGPALSPIHANCITMEPAGVAGCERLQARGPYSIWWFRDFRNAAIATDALENLGRIDVAFVWPAQGGLQYRVTPSFPIVTKELCDEPNHARRGGRILFGPRSRLAWLSRWKSFWPRSDSQRRADACQILPEGIATPADRSN
jgi:hypothetical protein